MKQLINAWLNGKRSFTYGVILYNRYGKDEDLKKLFEAGKTDFTEKKLLECLNGLASEDKQEAFSFSPFQGNEEMPESDDEVIMALRNQWMPHYTKMNYLRHDLDKYLERNSSSAEVKRGQLAREILMLEKNCMAVWAKRDHYVRTGKLPAEYKSNDPVVDPFKAGVRLKIVQGYVRRYKGYVQRDPANESHAANLKKYQAELVTLNQQNEGTAK